jgi:arginine-tRNA-protein transferase
MKWSVTDWYPYISEKRQQETTFDLASAVHEAETTYVRGDIATDHVFEVTLEGDTFTEEKFALFEDYQRHVHHEDDDDISRMGFKRFLCSSPLHRSGSDASDEKLLGSYHQCYRLDGRLIAMAVLDFLPHAVSGVYFIYHRDFEKWSFGKLSAVREASLALERGYGYYYMGYYIHSCRKMRYKGDYRPQHVLDLHSMQWDPLDDDMRTLMDDRKYASMSQERARRAIEQHSAPLVKDEARTMSRESQADIDMSDGQSNVDHADNPIHANPLDAMNAVLSGTSLLALNVPGVLSEDQLARQVDLDRLKIWLGEAIPVFETQVR